TAQVNDLKIVNLHGTGHRTSSGPPPKVDNCCGANLRGEAVKLDTFSYSASAGWSVASLPDLDSEDTLVVVFGTPELDEVQEPLGQLMAAYGRSHVIGCSTAGEIFGTALTDHSLSVAVVRFEHGTRVATASASVCSQDESFAAGESIARQLQDP